jgi:predicted MPP superfamily phosphohydrolase
MKPSPWNIAGSTSGSVFVTSGVGTSIVPVRFRVPPEIVILEMIAAD